MTEQELTDAVWKLIDDNCMGMSQEEYLSFLQGLRDDADVRAESVEQEIEDREGE